MSPRKAWGNNVRVGPEWVAEESGIQAEESAIREAVTPAVIRAAAVIQAVVIRAVAAILAAVVVIPVVAAVILPEAAVILAEETRTTIRAAGLRAP